jgi:Rrf2 family protein
MPLLPRKGVLAVAAVLDVALNAHNRPVSAKALAERHGLPPRHLEPVLQALVHVGILRGIRGPRGGYELARERGSINAEQILRAAGSVDETDPASSSESRLVTDVVLPALAQAERAFALALSGLSLEDLARAAETSATKRRGS